MSETTSKNGLTGMRGHRAILISVMGLGLAFCPLARAGQSVTLAWGASPDKNATGYMIHYGSEVANYVNKVDAGTNTSWSVTGLKEGTTNYFVVSAYDVNHSESATSNQTVYYVPGVVQLATGSVRTESGSRQAVAVNFPVAPGHTYSVQASTDLKNWRTIWQTTATSNAWMQFQDPVAANLQMRFYRTISN